ncbi:winged helix-turn-helix domain-containing protein [Paramicrobacterium humi]|nr:crosslink repair DNA glycosylase YcaQ family protein [Microbacterium humi]
MPSTISAAVARRIALAAQGFTRPRPATVGTRQFGLVIDRLGVLQIDSVNVFERSHYLPVLARVGPYDKSALDALTHGGKGPFIEWWGHEATFMRRDQLPMWRWKMKRIRERDLGNPDSWANQNLPLLQWLRDELASTGPIVSSAIEHDANHSRAGWWEWSAVKRGLETLFRWGDVVSAGRTTSFERRYALPEQVLPTALLDEEPDAADAARALVAHAASATGIATASDLADYYRLPADITRAAVRELADEGVLEPVSVAGWGAEGRPAPAWLHSGARRPRTVDAAALLSPFDPVVWTRARAERMFGFRYRIEIYTPRHKRVHGYYVLPVLVGDRLVARLDLKNDRQAGVLRVQSAWREPEAPPESVERIASLLEHTADWQGSGTISVGARGDLADELAGVLRAERHESR